MSKPKIPAPSSLDKVGAAIWASVTSTYDLRADELLTLEDACAASDVIAVLEAKWRELGRPIITTGSMGQEVEHPLIGSIDKQRKTRNALWRQLKLPDAEDGAGESNQHRAAAQSKWAKRA